jgi:flagellar biosynthesis anti-sigma factor FlgM
MRIDDRGQLSRLEKIRTGRPEPLGERLRSEEDRVEISPEARALSVALETIRQTPEVRHDLVAELRQQVLDGSFEFDTSRLVGKLLGKNG